MSLDLHPVQVRLGDEAFEALRMLAEVEGKDLGEVARERLTRLLLGEAHAVKVLAERMARATRRVNER